MKKFMNILILAGVIGIWGTAGAADAESITYAQTIRQVMFFGALTAFGVYGKVIFTRMSYNHKKAVIIKFKSKNAA